MSTNNTATDNKYNHDVSEKIAHFSDETIEKVENVFCNIEKKSKECCKSMEKSISDNPLLAVGIAAAAGALLAMLLRR